MKHLLSLSILSLCLLLSACNIRVGPSSSHTMNFDQYLGLTLDGKISKVTITDQCVTFEQPFPHMGRHAFYYPFVDGLPYLPKLENALKAAKEAGHTITVVDERVELPSGRQK
ncbi:MAG: hypothetical protein WC530_11065 [Candidatus Omnitrophota bacterium]